MFRKYISLNRHLPLPHPRPRRPHMGCLNKENRRETTSGHAMAASAAGRDGRGGRRVVERRGREGVGEGKAGGAKVGQPSTSTAM